MKNRMMAILATVLICGITQAEIITATVTGSGSGTLGVNAFTDSAFTWTISYDTANVYEPFGEATSIYLNPTVSEITVAGLASASVTLEHGVLTAPNDLAFVFTPVIMTGTAQGANILAVTDPTKPSWDGTSAYSASGGIAAVFTLFSNITTSQGALTMTTGEVDSFTAIPEPATIAFIGLFGGGLLVVRRLFMI
ncbi:hypothetical protein P4E94_07645 [Pontiellaceae bacterium B12219]|nr:hypothetical protein [Pontiellaceae bacterium B12219]